MVLADLVWGSYLVGNLMLSHIGVGFLLLAGKYFQKKIFEKIFEDFFLKKILHPGQASLGHVKVTLRNRF